MTRVIRQSDRTRFPLEIECERCETIFFAEKNDLIYSHDVGGVLVNCPACEGSNYVDVDFFTENEVRKATTDPMLRELLIILGILVIFVLFVIFGLRPS